MTIKKGVETIDDIKPDHLYRVSRAAEIFGYGPQSIRDKIKSGELPQPFPLSASSRFEAWLGQDILDHRAHMRVLAAKRLQQPAPSQPEQFKPKVKKVKLRPPGSRAAS
jgi:predicted DNA-binding transcriptional regulator AlpA